MQVLGALAEKVGSIFCKYLVRPIGVPYFFTGALSVKTGTHRIYNDTGVNFTIEGFRISVGTAPTGASLILDVNKGGSTIYTTQANRPTLTAGSNTVKHTTAPDTTAWNDGEYLTIDIDQVGSTLAGADLVVQVICRRS